MKDFNLGFCRQCLNEKYKLKLLSEDCIYEMYPGTCVRCKGAKNIVSRLHLSARIGVSLGLKRANKKQRMQYAEMEKIRMETPDNFDFITTTEYSVEKPQEELL